MKKLNKRQLNKLVEMIEDTLNVWLDETRVYTGMDDYWKGKENAFLLIQDYIKAAKDYCKKTI